MGQRVAVPGRAPRVTASGCHANFSYTRARMLLECLECESEIADINRQLVLHASHRAFCRDVGHPKLVSHVVGSGLVLGGSNPGFLSLGECFLSRGAAG